MTARAAGAVQRRRSVRTLVLEASASTLRLTRMTATIATVAGCALMLTSLVVRAERTTVYYYTDPQGNVLAVADAAGNIIERRDYVPYGAPASGIPSDGPGYTGHVSDEGTSLVYMQQRYYDPAVGRFLSVDPVSFAQRTSQSLSRYEYANGNPYRFIDPDGRDTVAFGVAGSVSWLGGMSAQGQLTVSYQGMDPSTWRFGVLGSTGGIAASQPGIGGNFALSISDANSAEEMAADGGDASAGGSVTFGPVSVGYERSLCTECLPVTTYSFGPKLSPLPFEVHTGVAKAAGATLIGSRPGAPTVTVGPIEIVPRTPPQPDPLPR